MPLDVSLYLPRSGYDVVTDLSGSPADFNEGLNADPIFVYISRRNQRPQHSEIELSFNTTGSFTIAHFSDLHLSNGDAVCQDVPDPFKANCTEQFTFTFMERALDLVKPDLVIINGDLYAENRLRRTGTRYPQLTEGAIAKAIFPILQRKITFATTWGNHDAEGNLVVSAHKSHKFGSRKQIFVAGGTSAHNGYTTWLCWLQRPN